DSSTTPATETTTRYYSIAGTRIAMNDGGQRPAPSAACALSLWGRGWYSAWGDNWIRYWCSSNHWYILCS
ncbi:MAG: hypothetical protein OEY93_09995, partial [Anaerolineae bacterium]|nr:hypothetical protein [Anaerolineae bacterium]